MDELSLEPEKDFFEEDYRSKVIKELTDDEEIDTAIDLLKEKYDVPVKDTTSGEPEPKRPEEQVADTSEKPEDKTKLELKSKDGDQEPTKPDEPVKPAEFVLTNELIQKQPEEYREILNKYKGKGKADLAKAAANAAALKSPYLKDNEKAIEAITEKFKNLSDEEIVKTLVETQAKTGLTTEEKPKFEQTPKEEQIELPVLPEDGEIKKILDKETIKQLKKLGYDNIPEDFNSDEYKEWERDMQDAGGLLKVKKYLSDLESTETKVRTELRKVVYAQTNLQNLYNDSPAEILPLLTEQNLPRLKKLNDDYRGVNNKSLEEEVGLIKKELANYGITETDLGVDLTLTKDENGSYFNEGLNSLMLNGNETDPNVVGQMGKVPLLKRGQLTKKFIYENNGKILTFLVNNKAKQAKVEVEKLKDDVLNISGESKTSGLKTIINPDDVKKITDDTKLDKIIDDLRGKYS